MVNLKDWIIVNLKWWIRRTLKLRGELETRIDSIVKQINEVCEEVCHTIKDKYMQDSKIDCSNLSKVYENENFPRKIFISELRKKRIDMENDIYNDYHQFCNVPTIRGISGLVGFILSLLGFVITLLCYFIYSNKISVSSDINNNVKISLIVLAIFFFVISIYLLFREHKKIDIRNKEYWIFWLKETGDEYRKKIPVLHRLLLLIALMLEGYVVALTIVSFISSEINMKTATYISVIAGLTVAFFLEQLCIDAGRSLYRIDVAKNLNKRFKDQVEFLGERLTVKDVFKKINPTETMSLEYLPKSNLFRKYFKLITSFLLVFIVGLLLFIQRTSIKLNFLMENNNLKVTYSAALLLLVMLLIVYVYTVWVGHKYSYVSDYSEIAKFGVSNYNKVLSHNKKLSELAQKNFHSFFISLSEILEETSSSNSNPNVNNAYKCINARGEYEFKCSDT